MKVSHCALIPVLALALSVASCDNGNDNSKGDPVAYKVYTGYSYRGPRANGDSTFFYHTTGRAAFESLFYYLDEARHDTIPKIDIATQRAVSVVKYSNEEYLLDAALAYQVGDTLELEYTATLLHADMSFTIAQSMIVMVDASFRNVKFIENGKLIKRL